MTRLLKALSDYELRNLVSHLLAVGTREADLERLLELVDDGRNALWAELEARNDTRSFVEAMALAKQAALRASEEQVRRGEPTTRLLDAVRYTCYTASLRSISGAVPAKALAKAVACGVLEAGQAATYARQILAPADRAAALAQLTAFFTAEALTAEAMEAVREAVRPRRKAAPLLTVAKTIPERELPALMEALRSLEDPKLSLEMRATAAERRPDLLAEALEQARSHDHPAIRALGLARLLPLLPSEMRPGTTETALDDALKMPRRSPDGTISYGSHDMRHPEAVTALIPFLTTEQCARVHEAVDGMWDHKDRVHVLAALARRREGAARKALVAQALDVVRQIPNQIDRAKAAAPLLGLLPRRKARRILRRSRLWAGSEWMADKLVTSAPHVEGAVAPDYLAIARRIRVAEHRARALGAVIPYLDPERQKNVARDAWQAITAWRPRHEAEQSSRRELIDDVVTLLDEGEVRALLQAEFQVGDADAAARTVSSLGTWMSTEIGRALDATAQIDDPGTRAKNLSALVKALPAELLPRALAIARDLDPDRRITPLAALAARHDPPELMSEILQTIRKSRKSRTGSVLSTPDFIAIYAHFGEELHEEDMALLVDSYRPFSRRTLAALAERLTRARLRALLDTRLWYLVAPNVPDEMIYEVLDLAVRRLPEYGAVDVLAALAERLPLDDIQRITTAAKECRNPAGRAQLLTAVAARTGDERIIEDALDIIETLSSKSPDETHMERLTALAKAVAGHETRHYQRLMDAALALKAPGLRAIALRWVLPCLPPELLEPTLTQIRKHFADDWPTFARRILPAVHGTLKADLIAEIQHRDPAGMRYDLERLSGDLDEDTWNELVAWVIAANRAEELDATVLGRLPPATAAELLTTEVGRESTLEGRGGRWEPLVQAMAGAQGPLVHSVLQAWLAGPDRSRQQLLYEIASLSPLLLAVGPADCAGRLAQIIDDTETWWP